MWLILFVFLVGFKGVGDIRYIMMIVFIGMWLFRIVVGYFVGIVCKVGVFGVWIGMYFDWIIRGIMYCFRFNGDKWIEYRILLD